MILTQPSRYKRAESNLLADKKGPHHIGQLVVYTKTFMPWPIKSTDATGL